MRSCAGRLVVHRDGTVAYCTEDHAGRRCMGHERPHRGGTFACTLLARGTCDHCNQTAAATSR